MERMKEEERELFFAYYILDIYYSLNSIIDSIDLSLGHYSCNNVDTLRFRIIEGAGIVGGLET